MVFWLKRRGPRNEEVLQAIALLEKAGRKGKQPLWLDIAARLRKPRRNRVAVNLWKIEKMNAKRGKKFLLVPGKVLSFGELGKGANVIALEFSAAARKKIGEKGKALTIPEALKENIKARDIAIVC